LNAIALTVAVGIVLQPTAVQIGQVCGALVWPASAIFVAFGLRDALQRDAADLAARLEQQRRSAVEKGFHRGRRFVIDLATTTAEDAEAAYLRASHRLPPEVADEIGRRLREARERLADLDAAGSDS